MEENKNNKVWLGTLIGILVLLVIGLTGFIVYDKILNSDDKSEQVKNNNPVEVDDKINTNEFANVDVNSQVVSSAMCLVLNKNNSILSSGCYFQYHLYYSYAENILSGKLTLNELDYDNILQLIYENISSTDKPAQFETDKVYKIDESTFVNAAKKVFGNNYKIPETGYAGCDVNINYNDNQKVYEVKEALMGDSSMVSATNTYISAKMNNDTLIVVEKIHFSYPEDIVTDEVKQNYSNDLTLEYTFKKDSDTSFYFYSIESK